MINVILGKPGSGKTLYCTKQIIKLLRDTKKNIVTNVPLRLDVLNEWVQKKYPAEDLQVPQRVRMMRDDEMKEFWKLRGPTNFHEEFPDDLPPFSFAHDPAADAGINAANFQAAQIAYGRALEKRDAAQLAWFKNVGDSKGNRGVVYVLDECHIAFNARDWSTIGRGALHYLSQHRKLSDDVFPVTQAAGNLDKQFRSVAECFTVLRNEYTAQYGIFKGRGRFTWKSYHKEPEANAQPFQWGAFQFDGEENCYDTARGIGVAGGNGADIGRRAKGIPVIWMIPAIAAALFACMFVPYWGMKAWGKSASKKQLTDTITAPITVQKQPEAPPQKEQVVNVNVKEPPPLYVTAFAASANGAVVSLSDGSTVRSGDVDFQGRTRLTVVNDHYAKVDGRLLPVIRKPPRPQAAPPQPQQKQDRHDVTVSVPRGLLGLPAQAKAVPTK